MKTLDSRKALGTVWRKKITDDGKKIYTKEVIVSEAEFREAERIYDKKIKLKYLMKSS